MSINEGAGRSPAPETSALVAALGDLHVQAGRPSARSIAREVGAVSHTTVAEALSGRRLPSWPVLSRIVNALGGDEESFRQLWTDIEYRRGALTTASTDTTHVARTVFVVHGRDGQAHAAMYDFLRALDLRLLEWETLVTATQKGAPSLLTVLQTAMVHAQAVLVLLTPDDLVHSRPASDERAAGSGEWRPRPNVLIELGIALAMQPDRTIIVQIGEIDSISDLDGLNVIRMDGSAVALEQLVHRLKTVGCAVDDRGADWRREERFSHLKFEPTWYLTAAEAGNTEAMYNLGLLLAQRGDTAEAERWWRTAAEAGNTTAVYNLGLLLAERGDTAEAERWWRTAAEAGNTSAMANLGLLLAQRGDTAEAERWYRAAVNDAALA